MAIFPRRIVQKSINEIRGLLPAEQLKKCIQELNSSDLVRSIAREWEVIILNALSKVSTISTIEYEKIFEGGERHPDVFCKLTNGTCFLADITTISDRGAHESNPVDFLFRQIHAFLREKQAPSQGIDIRIAGDFVGKPGYQKVKLALPQKKDIPEFIEHNLSSFATHIASNISEPHHISIEYDGINIRISYNPGNYFSGGGYPVYTSFYSRTRNPIYHRLKEKSDQLKRSGFLGITGIFLCDGGCSSLNGSANGTREISQDTVIQHFFESNNQVSFILTITPEEDHFSLWSSAREKYNKFKFYSNPNTNFPVTSDLVEALELMRQNLPTPESMPFNALRHLEENPNTGLSHYGGYSMTGNTLKISARTLAELLAGVIDIDRFNADHFGHNAEDSYTSDFFRSRIAEGRMIEKIELEKSEESDDDWVVIRFGEPDPAISPYR